MGEMMQCIRTRSFCLLAALLSIAATATFAGDDYLVPLDGRAFKGAIVSIDKDENVRVGGRKQPIALQGLMRIDRKSVRLVPPKPGIAVHLTDGSVIRARSVVANQEVCTVDCAFGRGWKLPLGVVNAVRFETVGSGKEKLKSVERFEETLEAGEEERKQDALFVAVDGELQAVAGGLQELGKGKVVFVWNDKARKVSRKKVYGIAFARTVAAPSTIGRCRIVTKDGSGIWGKVAGLAKGRLTASMIGQGKLSLPWNSVARMEVQSDRLVFLSDLKPLKAVQQAQMTFPGPYRKDRSVLGNELTLGKNTYAKGLGVHAYCLLTFPCEKRFDFFVATIGIDAETKGKGDCVFKVLGDGRELFKRRMRGKDAPVPIRVKISGVEEITLIVEPGEDFDLADHANWCDARLLAAKAAK